MSATVRQMGPTRITRPAPIMPSRLTSSCVGAIAPALFALAGPRTEEPVSSAMAQVTMFVATVFHYATGNGSPANSFKNFAVLLGLILIGPGKYSLDALLQREVPATEVPKPDL